MAASKPPKKGKTVAPFVLKAPNSDAPTVAPLLLEAPNSDAPTDAVSSPAPRTNAVKTGVRTAVGMKRASAPVAARIGAPTDASVRGAVRTSAPRDAHAPSAAGMTGHQYRDLIASYIHHNYSSEGIDVYVEISLGKTIIGKDRYIDVFVVRPDDRKALAIECKYQDSLGTVDEKIPYALQDLEALWVPGCLVYAGRGWSKGVQHVLEASRLAAQCMPDAFNLAPSRLTRELDHILAAIFGLWDLVLPANKRFPARPF